MNVLAIGAHPDDIELGCGATLAGHSKRGDNITMLIVTSGETDRGAAKRRLEEQEESARILGAELVWGNMPYGDLPTCRAIVTMIDGVAMEASADIVYTHALLDSHQDHRAVGQASVSAGRRVDRVLHYESPTREKFDPVIFVDCTGLLTVKLDLLRCHASQLRPSSFVDMDAISAQCRYWGWIARVEYAEAFETRRLRLDVSANSFGLGGETSTR